MKACVLRAAGDLNVEDLPEPFPGTGEVIISLGAGGICGSDLHYFAEGGVGDFRLRQPLTLGHEVAGQVLAVGASVSRLKPGDRVAVNPSHPCGHCRPCLEGRRNLCRNARFFGSAARFPHVQGAFSERFVAAEGNCFPIPDSLSFRAAACAEPLAVCLHAFGLAGSVAGRNVLVTGSGPIGVLLVAAARMGGAARVCVTDLCDEALAIGLSMGATDSINVAREPDRLTGLTAELDGFDAVFEATGHPAGLASAIGAATLGGVLVQVGMLPRGQTPAPFHPIVARELRVVGSFRFDREYPVAVAAIAGGRVDVAPMLTHEFAFSELGAAFEMAGDRRRAMKVSLRPS
jgi:L-idonate 5-dehydrogenase